MSERQTDCPFCDIVHGDARAEIVLDWPTAIGFVPLNPVAVGHVLIVPRVHVEDFIKNPNVTADTMRAAAGFARTMTDWPGINLITSAGVAATQSVFHLHVHLVPRSYDDGLHLPWTGQQIRPLR